MSLQPPPVFTPVQDKSGVIVPIWSDFFVAIKAVSDALDAAPVLVTTATPALPASVNLGALTTGLLKATVTAGVAAISSLALPLAVANGGIGIGSGTSGGVLAFTGPATITSSAALIANQLVVGGGSGAVPATLGTLGTTTTVLHGNAAGPPTFAAVSLAADVSGTLPIANGGTNATAQTNNGIAYFDATKITTDSGLTFVPATGTVTLTAPAAQNATLAIAAPANQTVSAKLNENSTNVWQVGFNITGSTKAFEFYNTANAATMISVTAAALTTLTAPANQNAIWKAVSVLSNGFGAQSVFQSKTAGGTTHTWTLGTAVSGSANTFEFYEAAFGLVASMEVGGRFNHLSVANLKNYTVATLPAGVRGDIAYVTNALAPTFLAVVVGGGAVVAPVFYDGANWVGF